MRHRFHTHCMHECIRAHAEICSTCTYSYSMPAHAKMWIYGLYGLVGLVPTHIYIYAWWQGWNCMHMLWYTCICQGEHVCMCVVRMWCVFLLSYVFLSHPPLPLASFSPHSHCSLPPLRLSLLFCSVSPLLFNGGLGRLGRFED